MAAANGAMGGDLLSVRKKLSLSFNAESKLRRHFHGNDKHGRGTKGPPIFGTSFQHTDNETLCLI